MVYATPLLGGFLAAVQNRIIVHNDGTISAALEGLGKLLNTIKVVQQKFNIELEIEGLLLTMYDTRLRLANQVVEEVKAHFQDMVFKTIIHRNVRLGESPSFGETIVIHDATRKGAINYINLANEVLQKNTATV